MSSSKYLALGLSILLSSGCALVEKMQSSVDSRYVRKLDIPLLDIRNVVISQLPNGQSSISVNGRVFKSKHFVYSGENFKPGENNIDRYFAEIAILGDRRPYDVEVSVHHERRILRGNEIVYAEMGPDPRLAQVLVERLQDALSKRREDRNIIDDFRVF